MNISANRYADGEQSDKLANGTNLGSREAERMRRSHRTLNLSSRNRLRVKAYGQSWADCFDAFRVIATLTTTQSALNYACIVVRRRDLLENTNARTQAAIDFIRSCRAMPGGF